MDIGIGAILSASDLQSTLQRQVPSCIVRVVGSFEELLGLEGDVRVVRSESPSELPTGIQVNARLREGTDYEAWLREIARSLSEMLNCRTIVDGTRFGDSPSPYWSLVFDGSVAYLADDLGSAFGEDDPKGGPVRIIRQLRAESFGPRLNLAEHVIMGDPTS